ncbi:MAG TPA: DUF456 domain-containing protein [Pilimelia sp.]|nr:DUF456 domain-containing protein [Pilimelia sp.]
MDLSDTDTAVTILCAIAIAVGIAGVVVPMLPGLVLCWAGVLVWAIFADGGAEKWVVLAIVTLIAALGTVVKYAWPGRNLKRTGVPNMSLLAGGLLGLVGFFVIPVVGLVIGFVLGVLLAERVRLGTMALAWPSTKQAIKAAGLAMLIELGTALSIAAVWIVGAFTV